MKKRVILSIFILLLSLTAVAQVYLDPQAPMEERIKDALSRMTLHEKILMLHEQSKFTSAGVPRLGIRQLNMSDGPHGVREELAWSEWRSANWTNDAIVAFPSLTCLAATWNTELAALYGHSVSEEFAFRGKDLMLGPGVNIQRTPMNGRAFEYMGEDPLLAGEMAVPYIQAVQKNGVGCCLKHFVLNDQETDRWGVSVNVSERAMREIYLYPFEQAVKRAKVWSIMGSYNQWNNVHCCHNDVLLNGILKKEWGFDGAVVSDWDGTHDTWQAATGGLDIEMGTSRNTTIKDKKFTYDDCYLGQPFEQLIKDGKLPMSVLDEKVSRVLRLIFRTAMNPKKVIGNQCSEAHYDACLKIAEEGIVLMKNNHKSVTPSPSSKGEVSGQILPIDFSNYKKVLVVGENATRSLTLGGGSSELKAEHESTPLEAMQTAVSALRDSQQQSVPALVYAQGYTSGRAIYNKVDAVKADEQARLKAEALEQAKDADLIVFIGGLNKNHHQDCEDGDRESYELSFGQNELISELAAIQPNIVVVTYGGNPYAMPWIDKVGALVHCWYLGSQSGVALANVLTGKTCPSGKLPVTFAKKYEDYPYVKYGKTAYPGVKFGEEGYPETEKDQGPQVYYKEGIFVGYRGFEHDKKQPLFPFGYGLSYTSFKYEEPDVQFDGRDITARVTIQNSGSVAGKEIVQFYVTAPKNKQLEKPVKELKAFAKTRLLQPGESETLTVKIPRERLASWDEQTHVWVVDNGKYTVQIAASSVDVRGKKTIKVNE